ncbi:MAG TPA: cytochrome c peroxidase [Anaeromyxobacteraceae bacterium]|nr:cytochrome c peroxidase [Anaeromyxobacteraceae bacterium]
MPDPRSTPEPTAWERANPTRPLPDPPLGVAAELADVEFRVTPAKVRLGRWLFYDPRLSADGKVSCATCHQPEHGFSQLEPVSTGVHGKRGTRKAPPILNVAFPVYPVFFWDGRATTLVEQAKGPMANPVEMGMDAADLVRALRAIPGYRKYFAEAFGDDRIDVDRVAEAIAAYEATRLSGNSAYDRWDAGDSRAFTQEQQLGREIFFGKAGCNQCHLGFNLTDARFHNLGVGFKQPPPGADPGTGFVDRGRAGVTGKDADLGAFKTPTLRDVSRRAPYMHDGSVATLREVVELYDRGGVPNPWLAKEMKPLHLAPGEVDALVAFLATLDGEGYRDEAPAAFPQ